MFSRFLPYLSCCPTYGRRRPRYQLCYQPLRVILTRVIFRVTSPVFSGLSRRPVGGPVSYRPRCHGFVTSSATSPCASSGSPPRSVYHRTESNTLPHSDQKRRQRGREKREKSPPLRRRCSVREAVTPGTKGPTKGQLAAIPMRARSGHRTSDGAGRTSRIGQCWSRNGPPWRASGRRRSPLNFVMHRATGHAGGGFFA